MFGKSGIHWIEDTLTPGIKQFPDDLDRGMNNLVEYMVPRTEAYMRLNAPWQDQTGNARNGLRAEAVHEIGSHGIDVFHSVPYGIWLEVRFEGRYQIILPTVKTMGQELMRQASGMIGQL